MDILKSNRLIAEFMGGFFPKDMATLKPSENRVILKSTEYYFSHRFSSNVVKYHESWDWLMPVVEACLHNEYDEHQARDLTHALLDCNMSGVYEAVVKFIVEYNEPADKLNQPTPQIITTWDFVEKYYPNYSNCDEIARNNLLCQIGNSTYEEGSEAEYLYTHIYESNTDHAADDYKKSCAYIYEEAIRGYINSINNN